MKTLKLTTVLIVLSLCIQSAFARGQKVGLYLTLEDYLKHKLSYVADGSNGTRIQLQNMFGGKNVVVIQDGKKQVFQKNEIFGYHAEDQDFRYFNNIAYRIIDTGGFFIYTHSKLIQQGKGPKPVEQFYFSANPIGEIKSLTMDNLQSVFSKDTRFLYAVEGFFKSDEELPVYDTNLKEYKLKYLFAQTTK
jgi:hypothetical protein